VNDNSESSRKEAESIISKVVHADSADDIWGGLAKLGRIVQKLAAETAQKKRERRLARRRESYRIKKLQGRLPAKKKPQPPVERWEYEPPTACYCSAVQRPPCGWCEGEGIHEDEDD
jgi:hypothetical protein